MSSEIEQVERLHQAYLDLKENTSDMKRDRAECREYHAWYYMRNDYAYQEHLMALVYEIYDELIVVLNPIGVIPDFAQQENQGASFEVPHSNM